MINNQFSNEYFFYQKLIPDSLFNAFNDPKNEPMLITDGDNISLANFVSGEDNENIIKKRGRPKQ